MGIMTVLEQVGMLSVIMLIGFVVAKAGYIDIKYKDAISKLIVNLILPCLIISSISEKNLESELIGELLTVLLMAAFCIAILLGTGFLTVKLLKIPDATKSVHKLLATTGNVIFIGYPILVAMYGEKGFFYAIFYWLLNDLFLWTVGVFMLAGKNNVDKSARWKKLLNPNTISFAVAILMFVFGIKLPPIINSAVSVIGGLTTPLSMIFVGMALAAVDVKTTLKKWWIWVIAPIKLVIMPIVFIHLFKWIGIKEILIGIVVLEAAMPAQTVLTILANENKADCDYAAVGLFITTIASLATLPLVCYMLNIWL